MNFDLNPKQSTRSADAVPSQSAPQPSPAVPLSVYRELAAELQATQAMLDSLHAQNQHLRQQNVQLHQEVGVVLQSAQKMQQLVGIVNEPYGGVGGAAPKPPSRAVRSSPQSPLMGALGGDFLKGDGGRRGDGPRPDPKDRTAPLNPGQGRQWFSSQEEPLPRPTLGQTQSRELSGWWLMALVLFIVVSAFGTGFLIVRPFLSTNR